MSFGLSVGDVLTAIELANRIRKEFVSAPRQFKGISDEVRSLSIVLQDVEVVLAERELTSQQKTRLHDIANGCRSVLDSLDKTLDKYGELASVPEGIGKRAKRVWKRLKWEPEDIQELRSRISSNITLLNAFNGQLTRDNTVKLVQHQDNQERRTILDWLTPTDYGVHQSDFISRRQEGTGQWLLDSDEFQVWLNKSKQTLFCPGIPGAGKTMITSIVVEYLQLEFRDDSGIGIAYLYCNYRQQQEQKAEDLILNLLKQLAPEQFSVPTPIKNLYEYHRNRRTRPSFDEIVKLLHSIIGLYSRVFIIIDALDECHVSNEGRDRLLSVVFSLQAQAQTNVFVTSRFIPEVMSQFEGCISKEIRAKDDDILKYIDERIPQLLRSRISKYPDLQNSIRSEVVKAVDGMFLLAQLHMDSFLRKPTPGDIKLALRNLPRGINGLDMMYDQAVKRIEGQEEGFRELAKHVLSWITHAKRHLTTAELRHALAVRDGAVELDEDFVPDIEDLFSVCAGLITVDEQSHFIRWIHYTTQEYFERTWTLWTPHAQAYIASVCLTYLSFDTFESGSCPTDEEFENRLRLYPFYDYAARNWGYHAGAASIEVEQLIRGLLENDAKVAACSQAMMAAKLYPGDSGYSQRVPRQIAGVHLAAYFGLKEAMAVLLKNGHDPNIKDGFCRTPLSWAAEKGHDTMVRQLLATDGVDPDCGDNDGLTPLSRASWNGHEVVVQLLLAANDVDPDSKDNSGQTPLSWAAKKWHEAVVRQLLATDGVDPDSRDSNGLTALSWASWNGQEAVVKLLLATDAVNPDSKGRYGRTPLSWAAENGHEAVVELLLSSGCVDVNSKDIIRGRTPLSLATENGQEAVVKVLLASDGVDPDSKDKYGRTPLSLAAENGQEALVELLLAADGVDVNSGDTIRGRTPLSRAAENGHEAVARLLLATVGVDPDSKSNTGWTPLLVAARNGREAVVKLLLATHGIDPDSKDNDGGTPLSWAAANGHEAVVELLLATDGVDPDSRDKYGRPPLLVAARNGHQAVVKLLLATHGIDPNPKDAGGETPLYWAASRGHSDVVKLLLEKYKENGIAVRDKDMDIARQLEADRRSRIHCDICRSRIPDVDVYYHCRICNEGDFDICQECIASGAFCHDQSHKLIKETVKDGD